MLLVDTNVLVDVLENDPEWADWSIGQLRAQSKVHRLAINPIIYSELSLTFSTVEALDETIDELDLTLKGATKNNVLADFFIGAHAAVSRFPLLTRDTRRYKSYFPEVKLVAPEASP